MKKKLILLLLGAGLIFPGMALADFTWTPMVTAAMFDGIRADVVLACTSIFFILIVITGMAMIWRAVGR